MTQRGEQMQQLVGVSGIVMGISNLAVPRAAGRFWDIAPDSAPVVPFLIRIYGASLLALGAVTLAAEGDQRAPVLQIATAMAGITAMSGALAGATGSVGRRGAAMAIGAGAGLGALAWAAARV